MFTHILVPTDFTEKSLKAMDVAVKMALSEGCKLSLLHVIETIDNAEYEEFKGFYGKLKKRAEERMDETAGRYGREKLPVHTEIILGNRAREIIGFAQENDVDLIVLSSHKIDTDRPAEGWGTISYKVAILSHCPVLMIK
jgi:nucleotide-binding universal stress UspA family protein